MVTLSERKAREVVRRRAAAEAVAEELRTFARRHGGRILIFGSAVRGSMTETSDIDILIDVPEQVETEAWSFAEGVCRLHGIPADIHSAKTTKPDFLRRIEAMAKVLA